MVAGISEGGRCKFKVILIFPTSFLSDGAHELGTADPTVYRTIAKGAVDGKWQRSLTRGET